ncbi:MAG: response regulator transcription factor [Prolixibacteraceae bacterium]
MTKKIFFVEDDLSFGSVMKSYLELHEYDVTWVDDGKYAVDRFQGNKFDMAILDVMLPNVDGFTIGKEIKALRPELPLIYLTAKSLKDDILKGYGIGADDYVAKPFDSEVLLAKMNAILNRSEHEIQKNTGEVYHIGRYKFNYRFRTIEAGGHKNKLSPKEAGLLRMLCMKKNELLPRDEALQMIWGSDDYFMARSMDVYVTKLRKYFKDDPSIEIKNIHGSGFILEEL